MNLKSTGKMTKGDIIDACKRIREIDAIPDEVLDFMRQSAIQAINRRLAKIKTTMKRPDKEDYSLQDPQTGETFNIIDLKGYSKAQDEYIDYLEAILNSNEKCTNCGNDLVITERYCHNCDEYFS